MALPKIDPKESYNKGNFIKFMNGYNQFEGLKQSIDNDPSNPNLRKTLGGIVHDNSLAFATIEDGVVRDRAGNEYAGLIRALTGGFDANGKLEKGYVENNLEVILKEVDTEEMVNLIKRVPLSKTGNKDIDKTISALKIMQEVQTIAQNSKEDFTAMKQYVVSRLSAEPGYIQKAYAYSLSSEKYVRQLFEGYYNTATINFLKLVGDDKGEIDREKVERVYRKGLNVARTKFKEVEEKKRDEIFSREIAPYYLAAAKTLYECESKTKSKK